MIKLFSRTFSATPEDAKIDNEISEKISLLQTFLKPEHLDIPPILQNEASLLVRFILLKYVKVFYVIFIKIGKR